MDHILNISVITFSDHFCFTTFRELFHHHRLSVDLKRVVGHALCLESPDVEHVENWLKMEPVI